MPAGLPGRGAESAGARVPVGDGATLRGDLAEIDHWRRVARQRTAALDDLQRRPLVRVAVALDRRSAPVRRRVGAARRRLTEGAARARVTAAAMASRPARPRRRRRLDAALASLPPPEPAARSMTVVVPLPEGADPAAIPDLVGRDESTRLVPVVQGAETLAAAVARAVEGSASDLVCVLSPTSRPLEGGWLRRLAAGLVDDVVAAAPTLLHPARPLGHDTPHDLLVRAEGLELVAVEGTPHVRSRRAGAPVELGGRPVEVPAASAACLVVERRAYDAAGGLLPLPDLDAAVVDLCARLRSRGGRVVVVPGAAVEDGRPVGTMQALETPLVPGGPGWRSLIEHRGPALLRTAAPDPGLRIACTVACPSAKVAKRWGDWHLASALAVGLARYGHEVRVQTAPEADAPAGRCCDVHLVVRGLAPVRRTPGQRHVLWIVSHPESVETHECDEADLVLVASHRFAEALRQRTATPVEVMLQATDHHRFRPVPPDPAHVHPVTVVAKTREVLRPIVAAAIAVGLRPAIYGGGWHGFVDDELIVADFVPNEELPSVYSSAGVVLNDHWETMRAWGFVSNRLFDVLACGTPVVSDHIPEIVDLFGGAVPTYRTPDELGAIVRALLDEPAGARERAAAGRARVLASHTFDHRAGELLRALVRHGLVAGDEALPLAGAGRHVTEP
jgi:hypothetical protein